MTFAHPLALTLLVLLIPLAWLARTSRVRARRGAVFTLFAIAFAALVLAIADPHARLAARVTRVAIVPSVGVTTGENAENQRALAAWRAATPSADPFRVVVAGPDLGVAVAAALAEIPLGSPGEVALLGGGRSQGRELEPLLAAASMRGIRVHTRVTGSGGGLRLVAVEHRSRCDEREPVRLSATIESDVERDATLTVHEGEERLAQRAVHVRAGCARYEIDLTPKGSGPVTLTTRLAGPGTEPLAAGTERSALLVEGKSQVVCLTTDPARSSALTESLAPYGFVVAGVAPESFVASTLDGAAVLVVDDVIQGAWSEAMQRTVRERVETRGLGLLVAGARAGAATGGYAKSVLGALLPIDPSAREERRDPSVGLVIVLDTSGSMGGLRIELAKEVARLALRRLLPHDKAGIVEFYGSRRWAAPLQPAANAIELQRALDRLQAGGGTIIYSALEEAFYALLTAKTRYKHVLVLTDGGVESGPFEALGRRMADSGMQVHTVLIGPQGNSPFLQSLAQWGRGRFYACPSRFELPELRFLEPENAPLSSLREGALAVQRTTPAEATLALGGDALPTVGAWTDASVRDGATVLLRGAAAEPVLAGWDQGQGRVLTLATDLLARGDGLQQDARYGAFLADLLRSLARTRTSAGSELELTARPESLAIAVTGEATLATIGTGTREIAIPLLATGSGRTAAEFAWSALGAETSPVVVTVTTSAGTLRGAACPPLLAPERARDVRPVLHELVTRTGGTENGALPDTVPNATVASRSLARELALLAIVAFVLAVLVRRWPGRRRTARPATAVLAGLVALVGLAPSAFAQDSRAVRDDASVIAAEFGAHGSLDGLLARKDLTPALRVAALRAEGRFAEALAALPKEGLENAIERALLLEASGQADAARAAHTELLARSDLPADDRIGSLLRRAELAAHGRDPKAVEADLREVARTAPDDAARFRLAVLAGGYGLPALALELAPAREQDPALRCCFRARWNEALGRTAEAVAAWESAATVATLEREKRFALLQVVEAHRAASTLPTLVDRWKDAADPLRRSLRVRLLRELGRAEEALAALRDASTSGDDLRELLLLASETGRAGEGDRAVAARLAEHPRDLDTLRAFVIALVDRGDLAAAEARISAALPGAPTRTVLALAELAQELSLQGAFRACLGVLVKSGSERDRVEALLLEAQALRAARKPDLAAKLLLEAKDRALPPGDRARVAEQLEGLGKRAEALAIWRELWQTTKTEDVGLHLAWLLAEGQDAAQRTEAIAIYERVWLSAGAEARRKEAQARVLDTAAREGTLADLLLRLEREIRDPNTEQRETKRQALLEIYARAKDSAGAEAALARELADPARVVDAKLALARVYVECGELGRYATTLAELRKLDPANELDYAQQQAYAALERGRPTEARALVRELLARPGKLPEATRELAAGVLALSGKPKEAVTTYRMALAHHPERIETWLLYGGAMQKAGRTAEAHGVFCDLLLSEPPDDLLLVAIDGLLNLNAPPPMLRFAERTLRRRIASKPDKVYLLRALQDVLEELKDEPGRLSALASTLLVAGEQRGSFVRELVEEASTRGDTAGRARHARLLLALGDEIPPAVLVEVGQGLLAARDFAAAERAFERARFSTELSAVEAKIVAAYDGAGRSFEAERILRRTLRRDPDDTEKTLELARLLERRGSTEEALALALPLARQRLAEGLPTAQVASGLAGGRRGGQPMAGSPGPAGPVLLRVNQLQNPNQAKDKAGAMYEELRAIVLRCARASADVLPLVTALEELAKAEPKRALDAAVEVRVLAGAFADAALAGRARELEAALLARDPGANERKAVAMARVATGDLTGALEAMPKGAAAFDKELFKLTLLSGDLPGASGMARTASAADRAHAALGLFLAGAEDAARALVAEAPASRGRRAATGPLARLQRALGIDAPTESPFESRLEEIAALPTPVTRVAQTLSLLRLNPEVPTERKLTVLRGLLPAFADDAVGRLSTSFLDVARGVLPASELTEIARKALGASAGAGAGMVRIVLGSSLSAIEFLPVEERAEALDKILQKSSSEDRDMQILLAIYQGETLSPATQELLVGKLSGKAPAAGARNWLTMIASEPAPDRKLAKALAAKLPGDKDAVVALLKARAADTPAEAAEEAKHGLELLAAQDSSDGQPWRLAERLASYADAATKERFARADQATRLCEHFVRAAVLQEQGREMEALAALQAAHRARPGDAPLLNLVTNRATQLGDREAVFEAARLYASQVPTLYSFQAGALANQLLERGAAEEALAVLRRVEVGGAPLRTELRAIAGLADPVRRVVEGRRLLQDSRTGGIRFMLPNDPARAPATLDEALHPPRVELFPRTLAGSARASSDWAVLAVHPEGGELASTRLRTSSPTERLHALDLAFAKRAQAERTGTQAAELAAARAALARDPLAPAALAYLVVSATADDAELVLRHVLATALTEPIAWPVLAQTALLADDAGLHELGKRIGRLLVADREALSSADLRTVLPELLARFASDPETLLRLAPKDTPASPDLDGVLLGMLGTSTIDPERVRAAFRSIDDTSGRSRLRNDVLILPWLGVQLRCGDLAGATASWNRLLAAQDGADTTPALSYAAAVPPLASWKDAALAPRCAESWLAGARTAGTTGRMIALRLCGMLAQRYAEAGRTAEAEALRAQLAERYSAIPSAASWLRGAAR